MTRSIQIIASLFIAISLVYFTGALTRAHAEPAKRRLPPLRINPDNSVTVGENTYPDMSSYHRSEQFQQENRRCGTDAPPLSEMKAFDLSDCSVEQSLILPEYEVDQVWEIPVVFHVVMSSNGMGNPPDALLLSQLDVLNEDFLAIPGSSGGKGYNSGFRFILAKFDPNGEPTTGINRHVNDYWFIDEDDPVLGSMRANLSWDTSRYLNIFTNTPYDNIFGYATFPQYRAGMPDDGVVINHTYVGRNGPNAGEFNYGRTGTHEVGHYLGLRHTFHDGCGSASTPYTSGDLLADTLPHAEAYFTCDMDTDNGCGDGGSIPIHNYMGYVTDRCLELFTPEQVNRMRCSAINYRASLINVPPAAAFSPSTVAGNALSISLLDASSDSDGTIRLWRWDFGDGSTSTEQNPTHVYAASGSYNVTLTVTDDRGSETTVTRLVGTATLDLTGGCSVGGDRPLPWPAGLLFGLGSILYRARSRRTLG